MKNQLQNYDGLYRGNVPVSFPSYIRSESIKDRSGLFNCQISPHLHTHLLQIFFIESGSVKVEMTKGSYELTAPGVMIIPPGNVHGFTYDPLVIGRVITLEEMYIEELLQSAAGLLLNLKNIEFISEFDDEISFAHLLSITQQIDKELFDDLKERELALKTQLSFLFLKLYRLLDINRLAIAKQGLNEKYYKKFQKSFKKNMPFTRTIPDYATELNITAVHLNRVCHTITGKSCSWILQEHAIMEAKKLLVFTSYSMAEIANLLNFSDPAYFSRLFRKHLGITPGEFRKR